MHPIDWILIALLAAGVLSALRYRRRHRGCCGSCSGDCSRCAGREDCGRTEQK